MDSTNKHYIFDLGRVLVHYEPLYMAQAYIKDPKDAQTVSEVIFDRLYWDPLDDGTITDEALKAASHTRLPQRLHALADTVYDNWFFHLPLIDGMRELVLDIKKSGAKLFLLSNISIGFAEQYQRVPQLAELLSFFDGLVFSGPLGIVKPTPEIFHHLMGSYGLHAEDCIFIDDSPKNTAGAEAVGIHSYLFDGDAGKLRNYLGF